VEDVFIRMQIAYVWYLAKMEMKLKVPKYQHRHIQRVWEKPGPEQKLIGSVLDMVAQAYNPSSQEMEARESQSWHILGYIVRPYLKKERK
jgi:hypothetical protein